jgi:chloramphenicol-sensitive protein RarD
LFYGFSAYFVWGFIPIYFRAVAGLPSTIVLCHRIIWSALFMGLVVALRREGKAAFAHLRTGRTVLLLAAGALLIAMNWLTFIYAVAVRELLQASLGYFVNPLLSIALGMIFLGERLRPGQWAAVAVALFAVGNMALRAPGFPWIALSLAGSFGLYGLVRKKLNINSVHALLVESALLVPLALAGLWLLPHTPISRATLEVLSLSGIITAVPLLCFGAALRRLSLSTMGFLQYVGPTLQFLVALFLFHEPLDRMKLGSFVLCWVAIGVYVTDSLVRHAPAPVADEPD